MRKKEPKLNQYFARAGATLANWIEDRAKRTGYVSDGKCPKCGEEDPVFHRVWM